MSQDIEYYRSRNRRALRERPNMSDAEFRARSAVVNGAPCEICGRESEVPDHCHRTKTYRGPLCDRCNRGIGLFTENIRVLESAARYLRKYDYIYEFNGKPSYEGKPFG